MLSKVKESQTPSALTLTELQALSKFIQRETTPMETSPTPATETPTEEKSNTLAVLTPPKKIKSALEQFEKQVGGRLSMIDSIGLAQLDKKQQHFLDLMVDPKRAKHPIDKIAREAGLNPLQVIDLFRQAAFARANAIAMGRMAEALPAVIDDITDKSVDSKVECPSCFGKKQLAGADCPQCYGKGEVLRPSDWDRQKTILEATGVTKKGNTGVNVSVNTNVGIMTPGNFFSNYVKASDKAANDIDPNTIEADFEETK
jgi:hypothetical protein